MISTFPVEKVGPPLTTFVLLCAASVALRYGVFMDSVPANPSLIITRQATDAIVRCTGGITSETTQSLKATVRPLFSENKRVVLDLTDVNYVDSSGMGAIIALHVSAKFAGCQLKLIYSNENLKMLFGITRLDQLFAEGV